MQYSIINEPIWIQAIVLFISQIGFIYARTLNVYYNSKLNRLGVFLTGIVVHIFWLITIAVGATAIIKGNYILVLFSLSGGLLGADWALKNRIKNNK